MCNRLICCAAAVLLISGLALAGEGSYYGVAYVSVPAVSSDGFDAFSMNEATQLCNSAEEAQAAVKNLEQRLIDKARKTMMLTLKGDMLFDHGTIVSVNQDDNLERIQLEKFSGVNTVTIWDKAQPYEQAGHYVYVYEANGLYGTSAEAVAAAEKSEWIAVSMAIAAGKSKLGHPDWKDSQFSSRCEYSFKTVLVSEHYRGWIKVAVWYKDEPVYAAQSNNRYKVYTYCAPGTWETEDEALQSAHDFTQQAVAAALYQGGKDLGCEWGSGYYLQTSCQYGVETLKK
ncbi:MAG: hypothetical protein PHW04_13625 [Candidatus Wallbacteria bacterium]|nr:hypothetical protein [Candidatus Wallbacteria bacterium]